MKDIMALILLLVLIIGSVLGIRTCSFYITHYPLTVEVKELNGVEEHDRVNYLGVDIGEVMKVEEGKKSSFVTMEILNDAQIAEGSRITMNRVEMLETSVVRITPSQRDTYYAEGDTVFLPELDLWEEMKKFGKGMKELYDKGKVAFEEEIVPYLDSIAQEYEKSQAK